MLGTLHSGYVLKELRLLDHRRRPACPGRPWWHTRRLHLSSTLTDPFILTWSYVATLCLSQNMPRSNITSWRDKATVLPCASSPFAFSK
ncbi:hypothetical protein V2G26_010918 [Clonostachys chloroleuca]